MAWACFSARPIILAAVFSPILGNKQENRKKQLDLLDWQQIVVEQQDPLHELVQKPHATGYDKRNASSREFNL